LALVLLLVFCCKPWSKWAGSDTVGVPVTETPTAVEAAPLADIKPAGESDQAGVYNAPEDMQPLIAEEALSAAAETPDLVQADQPSELRDPTESLLTEEPGVSQSSQVAEVTTSRLAEASPTTDPGSQQSASEAEPALELEPAPPVETPPAITETVEVAPGPAPAEPSPAASTLDLDKLGSRLRSTKAIGMFTKLELKSEVEDLLDEMKAYHQSKSSLSLDQLEEHFDLLVMKLLLLLQDDDPQLQKEIARSRPVLWTTLADPEQFASIKGI
jgi:hypothetical protein